ncbi:MAG TPA: flavin reductase family protein, partial [Mycobacteriales bacterium]|nr:flavin reductase family protein [Mycobacteriales bacterium]
MSLDLKLVNSTLAGLRSLPIAITTVSGGRANGLISLSGNPGGVVPEAPRMTISLTKYNFTHDLVKSSGVFALHLLAATPEPARDHALQIIMGLGGGSGRDGDKIGQFRTKPGVTGAPILLDALTCLEGCVVKSLDCEENTIFLADVVGAQQLGDGSRLTLAEAWRTLPPAWIKQYEASHQAQ